jgi:(1->4)-alpha-D-glucan 1-alpha-D-glucosylmutase
MSRPIHSGIANQVRAELALRQRAPTATYRVQFHRGFTFRDATAQIDYWHCLGIDALYASPYLKARPESTHGYDVSDHNALNPAIGAENDYDTMACELRRRGMGQILDVVPNHMGIGEASNSWWMDVLENGPSSRFADYFDIDWRPVTGELRDRVLLPILGGQYGRVLESGELRLAYAEGRFTIHYYETVLPVAPSSYTLILQDTLDRLLMAGTSEEDDALIELASIAAAARNLPDESTRDPELRRDHHRESQVLKRRLGALVADGPSVRQAMEATLAAFAGTVGDPRSFDRLDELILAQHYRLAYWRVASEEINYRRFFDVNDLAALRMDNLEVFLETHRLVLRQLAEGKLTGLRIDHPDGLWDPAEYLARLQEHFLLALARRHASALDDEDPGVEEAVLRLLQEPTDAAGHAGHPLYVVAEKILALDEELPREWAVDGTVGYDFLNALNGLFVERRNERHIDRAYFRFIGQQVDFRDLVYQSKKLIMQVSLASEINTLAHLLRRIAAADRCHRDFTLYELRRAIREVIACFPVYRTYVRESDTRLSRRDRAYVEAAIVEARRRNPATDASYFEFLRDLLLLRSDRGASLEVRKLRRRAVMKLQQTTGPVAAKGVEDTAFYVYNRLSSLNEVGGEPDHFGTTVAAFHRFNADRCQEWPRALSATSTHDTKRSEDVRARISVLSELPAEWSGALRRWEQINRRKHRRVRGRSAPDRNEEYLLYQTLLGAWPLESFEGDVRTTFVERIVEYMRKATKEAKVNTSWINPNEEWDAALTRFIEAVLADEGFLAEFLPLQQRVARHGMYNALSQVLLKIASPGVPDIYQGQEVWDFSLVDPDNRRPVDYRRRALILDQLSGHHSSAELARDLLEHWEDGRIKLWVTHRALCCRRDRRGPFVDGDYRPIDVTGARRSNAVAFARVLGNEAIVAVASRFTTRLVGDDGGAPIGNEVWGDAALASAGVVPPGRYRDVLQGHEVIVDGSAIPVGKVLATLPVALLARVA